MTEDLHSERITEAAFESAARGRQFIEEKEKAEGGKIGGWFGTKHQLPNILAAAAVSLLIIIFMSIAGAIY